MIRCLRAARILSGFGMDGQTGLAVGPCHPSLLRGLNRFAAQRFARTLRQTILKNPEASLWRSRLIAAEGGGH
jgi:hypothetical protein